MEKSNPEPRPVPPLIAPRAPLDAYREDLARVEGRTSFGPPEEAWMLAALCLHRLASLPPAERRRRLPELATALRAASPDGERRAGTPASPDGADTPPATLERVQQALRQAGEPGGAEALADLTRALAAEMENAGAFRLAYTALAAVRKALPELGARAVGLVIAQQGRVARQFGDVDTAAELYATARDLGARGGVPEVEVHATLGQGVLASMRGNYPEARARYRDALERATASGLAPQVAAAHHGLMNAAFAAGDLNAALLHGWEAFRGAMSDAARRAEMLINLAAIAAKGGYYTAALQSYLAALGEAAAPRVQLAALGGAAVAAARLADHALLARLRIGAEDAMRECGQPYEAILTCLDLAEAHHAVHALEQASDYIGRATDDARMGGFHELLFRAEELAARYASEPPPNLHPSARHSLTPGARAVIGHLERLGADKRPAAAQAQYQGCV